MEVMSLLTDNTVHFRAIRSSAKCAATEEESRKCSFQTIVFKKKDGLQSWPVLDNVTVSGTSTLSNNKPS